MEGFKIHIESDKKIVPISIEEFREYERLKIRDAILRDYIEKEEEKVSSDGYDAIIYAKDIRRIIGAPKTDGLKVIF